MANIQDKLNNIKNALFGKDVRNSIHDGIDAINKEVESTTNRQEHLETTFDQLTINAGNSNAEIVDARVGENGKSYAKLGDRLDSVDSQLEHNVNELERTYNHINNFITDYKGICVRSWVEGSLYTNRFRSDLLSLVSEVGANSIALTVNTYQSSLTSNNPFNRVPIDLNEVEDYIKYLKSNNLRILFKHHVEVDESEYKWRAYIDPDDVDEWFLIYKNNIIEYAKLCERYKVEAFSIGSEYRTLTEKYPNKWIQLIKEIRKVYNGLLTYGANLNNDERDEVNYITFWDYLDFIGVDFYIYNNDGDYEEHINSFYHSKNHKNVVVLLDSVANKTNKPILFTEYGMNIDNTTSNNRNNYIKAVQDLFLNKEYAIGGFIWVFDPSVTNWFENDLELKMIFKSRNNKNKIIKNTKFFLTRKSSTSTNNYSLFSRYKLRKTYSDASCEFYITYRGLTNSTKEKYANLKIRVSIHDNLNNPHIQYEITEGDIDLSSLVYNIESGYVNFYVKVDNYSQVFYTLKDTCDIGLFEILEYQALQDVENKINATHKYLLNESNGGVVTLLADNKRLCCGTVKGSMDSGVITHLITLPTSISQVFGISVNVNYISGGNSYDVVTHGQYVGSNQIRVTGKHLSIQGNYAYELSYMVFYR